MLYSLCILAFVIPFPFIFGSWAIGILCFAWLMQGNFRQVFVNLWQRKWLWPWFLYWGLHAASYVYSENKSQSLFDTQTKLSFVLFPLIIGTSPAITRKNLEWIFLFFILGVSSVSAYSLARAAVMLYYHQPAEAIFYDKLVRGLDANAVTHAWYAMFSISLLMFFRWEKAFKGWWKYLKILLVLLQLTFFIMLSARTMIGLFFVFIVPYYFIRMAGRVSRWKLTAIGTCVVAIALTIALTENPIKERYKTVLTVDVSKAFLKDYTGVYESEFNNLTVRLFFWRLGFENMQEYNLWWFGAGNGDVFKLQNDRMATYGMNMYPPVEWWHSPFFNANLHNMYIQSWLMIGIGGIILLLVITFSPLITLKKIKIEAVFLIFNVLSICVMCQESTLQSQAGVVYYTFFNCILWALYYNSHSHESESVITD
jgi:O-antigen ligase